LLSVIVLAIAACSKPTSPGSTFAASVPGGPGNPLLEAATYNPSLQVDLAASTKSASGLYYRDLVVGTGDEAVGGKTVTAKYDGTLADGTRFDAGTYSFQLGARRVIRGWDEGVAGMHVGGKRQLIIPPDLGYGDGGMPPRIPGGAILVFSIELVSVQ